MKSEDYTTSYQPTWCPGCGNYGIWAAMRRALIQLKKPPHEVMCVYDVGCCGNGSNWFRSYGFHSLHGRSLPLAVGIKLANHTLTVISFAGDGGGVGEGGNHFLHTCRTNIDITFILHNNHLYSLTTGQTSPTSQRGMKTKTAPKGSLLEPLHPLQLAIMSGATFVARGYTDDLAHLSHILAQAISHRGFSVVDILQPCPTFNFFNTREWYRKHMYNLDETSWDPTQKDQALLKAAQWDGGKIPIGIIYKTKRPTFHDGKSSFKNGPLVQQVKKVDVKKFVERFR